MAAVGERQISYDARGLAEPVAEAPRTAVVENGVATFDATGTRTLSGSTPPGLAGTSIVFKAFANDAAGHLVDTAEERLDFE